MVNLYPPRKYWFAIILGFAIVVIVNLFLLVPFLGTIIASLAITWAMSVSQRKFLRTFLALFFWIGGFELVLLGILLILGFGLIPVFSAAASALFMTTGPLLGVIFIVVGIVAFVIGNLVSE